MDLNCFLLNNKIIYCSGGQHIDIDLAVQIHVGVIQGYHVYNEFHLFLDCLTVLELDCYFILSFWDLDI